MIRILQGDVREQLRSLPAESVHTCVTSPPYFGLRSYLPDDHPDKAMEIGLEPTPDAYVAEMVAVFRKVRRVLRKDGTCWLNLGDSYASGGRATYRSGASDNKGQLIQNDMPRPVDAPGIKPKDLLGIPWRVAFALQADGWWLRQDIIWSKLNPMPENVTDRCTKAHEYIFLLSKAERYFYDAEAIKEKVGEETRRTTEFRGESSPYKDHQSFNNSAAVKTYAPRGPPSLEGRNKRSVWTVATAPYFEAHFATFPPALIGPCILAGCPAKCCAKCGAPWVREVERTGHVNKREPAHVPGNTNTKVDSTGWAPMTRATLGFLPSCSCDAGTVAGTVLDCFGGAGTTGLVADRLQRNAVLIELSSDYAAMAERRCFDDAPLFAEAAE